MIVNLNLPLVFCFALAFSLTIDVNAFIAACFGLLPQYLPRGLHPSIVTLKYRTSFFPPLCSCTGSCTGSGTGTGTGTGTALTSFSLTGSALTGSALLDVFLEGVCLLVGITLYIISYILFIF